MTIVRGVGAFVDDSENRPRVRVIVIVVCDALNYQGTKH